MQFAAGVAPEMHSTAYEEFGDLVERIVAEHPKVRLINLRDALCKSGNCRLSEGNQGLYMDQTHLSPQGAQAALAGFRFQ